jgi:hypothetical protein
LSSEFLDSLLTESVSEVSRVVLGGLRIGAKLARDEIKKLKTFFHFFELKGKLAPGMVDVVLFSIGALVDAQVQMKKFVRNNC